METSSDSAAYELTWSAKYTSTYPLDHSPLMICLQLKEGRQQASNPIFKQLIQLILRGASSNHVSKGSPINFNIQ